ncbi:MAG: glycosyltransferase [Bacteroidetes bacterium]|nr:MAG: glycosyltransferase [Bacteroidota bacterium]
MSLHVICLMANNSSVPYFNWFAEAARNRSDVRFTFIALHKERPGMFADMEERGSRCIWVPFDDSRRKTSMLRAIVSLRRVFKNEKPDVVHSHLFDDSVPALIAARLAGVPVRVITKQDTAYHWFYAPKAVKYDRINNRNATHIVAVSEECKKFVLENEKADPLKVTMIHHGIPLEKLSASTDERKQELIRRFSLEGKFVIGTVARLIPWKGYKTIVETAAIIVQEIPEAHFLFSGEGDQKEELLRMIRERKLEKHITFTGWVDRADIPSLYAVMDVYLHAAAFEPFGFVIAEAMINGTPVVSTVTGSAADAITSGENGFLSASQSAEGLAEGIRFMKQHDRKAIGLRGQETARRMFPFEKMFESYVELYREACEINKMRHGE